MTALVGLPRPAAALHVDIKVEQPAYAGMPVWLDVAVDEPCVEVSYQGNLGGYASAGQAEVKSGGKPAPQGFQPTYYPHGDLATRGGACPSERRDLAGGAHRVPLHLVADLRTPGIYAVRWRVPETTQFGEVKPTEWLSFAVLPTSQATKEAWLTGLLRKAPEDAETTKDDYIPALLAAWPDSRVIHRLLDFLCSDDRTVGYAAMAAFRPTLSIDGQAYLAQLMTRGCASESLVSYVNLSVNLGFMFGGMSEVQRTRMLAAATVGLAVAHGVKLAHAIDLIGQLRNHRSDSVSADADAAVMRKVPEILASDERDDGSQNDPKWMLVDYLSYTNRPSGGRAVLEALARQQDAAAGYAIEQLIYRGDPADVVFLRDRLMGEVPKGFGDMQLKETFEALQKRFGPDAVGMLEPLTGAMTPRIAVAASLALDAGGDRVGTAAVLDALRNGREGEVSEILNQTIDTPECPLEHDECHEEVSRPSQLQESWAQARKAAAIEYFGMRLAGEK